MNHDFWFNIFFKCKNINDVLNFRTVCIHSKLKIDDEHFWKKMMYRDFEDIHKLNEESWLSYYKRRYINYGIPVLIDTKEKLPQLIDSDNFFHNMLNNNVLRCLYNLANSRIYILNKNYELYSFHRNQQILTYHLSDIRKIEMSANNRLLFVVDNKNDLYMSYSPSITKLLTNDVIDIFRSYSDDIKLYYTKKCGTYAILNDNDNTNIEIFDKQVLAWVKMKNKEYFIDHKNNLWERTPNVEKYKYLRLRIKAKQLSHLSHQYFIILGTDGLIRICNNDKIYHVDIRNVEYLSGDSFLTKNGDLYSFDKNMEAILMDTNVVDIGNFSSRKATGCYIKRC